MTVQPKRKKRWSKEFDFLTKTTDESIVLGKIKDFIHSTLQEYAKASIKAICKEFEKTEVFREDQAGFVKINNAEYLSILARMVIALHKLDVEYGIKK